MSFDQQSARVLDLLYATPGDPAAWVKLLREFSLLVHAPHIALIRYDGNTCKVGCAVGMPPDTARQYEEHYFKVDPYYLRAQDRLRAGDFVDAQEVCPPSEFRRTEYFNDFVEPNGYANLCFACVERIEKHNVAIFALWRTLHQKDFSDEEFRIIRQFVPHMQRALKLHRCFGDLKLRSQYQGWALDQLSFGLILLRLDGSVYFANRMAARICKGGGLGLRASGLYASGPQNQALQQLLGDAKKPQLWPPSHGTTTVQRSDGTPLVVTVGPVAVGDQNPLDASEPLIAIFIHDPSSQPACPEEVLHKGYGLTPAECRLATLLAGGVGVPAAAERFGVTVGTARAQLKTIFQKTSTNRQSQLARLLANLSPATF